MKKKKTETHAALVSDPSNALEAATKEVYRAFAKYSAPEVGTLDVCTACCMDADLALQMSRLPLHQLTEKHFYQYNDSAKSQVQPADEIKYIAPRLLELLTEGARLHHSTELYLDRLGRCEPGSFSATEQAGLQAFALAYFAQGLEEWPAASDSLFQGDNAFSILLMWAYARVPLEPLLQHWLDCESDASTLNFVDACYWDYVWNAHQIGNAFATDQVEYKRTMEAWLNTPATKTRWTEKLLRLVDAGPTSSWLPAGSLDHQCYPLPERISAVFDAMAT
ncbi:hypothetical protein J2W88_001100 [Acidovorax delafieldii]|uniref:Uncharacterized protein n=1 Tax=Acidovorax delafieldii TaxID=47920 RepID=A0AAJ2F039_ACIDE|nr:hypothetical protein [Acidovorax delafieldii]MDR6765842.1 hypothetical protein [Acidovorax delafieldii]MDR6836279.1 hypothetical protein [Acidovorax delafieldii]MDR7364750.1 hypothetical protein [Acidovorax delafieldii]